MDLNYRNWHRRVHVVALFFTLMLLTAISIHAANSVTIAWDSSPDSGVTGYKLYYGTAPHAYDKVVSAGSTTQATASDLIPGTTYYFAATAYNSAGTESDFSDEISFSTASHGTNPPPHEPDPTPSFTPARGTYYGLFYEKNEVNQESSGSFTVLTTSRGGYSGRLQLANAPYRFSGQLDAHGKGTNVIARQRGIPLKLELKVGSGDTADQISGHLTGDNWVANLSGNRVTFNARTNPAPSAGTYTMVIPGAEEGSNAPYGDGFGAVRVSAAGLASFSGSLADGTKVTQSAVLSKDNSWPFYVAPSSSKGSAISWLSINSADSRRTNLTGLLNWIKPANSSARYYPAGFTNEYEVIGSAYHRTVAPASRILNLDNASLVISEEASSSLFTNLVTVASNNRVLNLSSNKLTLTFSPATGTFRGNVTDPATKISRPFAGAVLQNFNAGFGTLLTTNLSRRVELF
jgi:hypothetical protein